MSAWDIVGREYGTELTRLQPEMKHFIRAADNPLLPSFMLDTTRPFTPDGGLICLHLPCTRLLLPLYPPPPSCEYYDRLLT